MPSPLALGIGSAVAGTAAQVSSAKSAAGAQAESAQLGIDEQRRQFDLTQELLAPFVDAGTSAVGGQLALTGLAGPEAQQAAINQIIGGPEFGALVQQGEEAIMQSAAATGGLRGGNTQAAVAQFRPQILSGLVNQQFGRLGGLAGMGQASAAGVGSAGQQSANAISDLLAQQGAAQAGSSLATGQAISSLIGNVAGGVAGALPAGPGNKLSLF